MIEPATCPRRNPAGERCGRPLLDSYGYRPCPDCTAAIQAAVDDANHWKAAAVAQALADGWTVDAETHLLVAPGKDIAVDEVIAGDRAGAPSRGGGSRPALSPAAQQRALRAGRPDPARLRRTTHRTA